jgi:Protein of unknown function (DUF2911)
MRDRHGSAAATMLVLAAFTASTASAQVRASEAGSVSQTVDGTTITIEYSRPVARGRTGLFGKVIHWGEMWTPGANWATTFEASRNVTVNGHRIPKGRYSLWMIPRENEDWMLVFSNRIRTFHTQRPTQGEDLVRFAVKPETSPQTEVLTWSFPAIAAEGSTLRMQWGTSAISLRITVEPSYTAQMEPEDAATFVGTYEMKLGDAPDAPTATIELALRDGRLRGHIEPKFPENDPDVDFLPAGENRFHIGFYREGKLFEVDAETIVTFTVENRKATKFEFIFEDESWARATRIR